MFTWSAPSWPFRASRTFRSLMKLSAHLTRSFSTSSCIIPLTRWPRLTLLKANFTSMGSDPVIYLRFQAWRVSLMSTATAPTRRHPYCPSGRAPAGLLSGGPLSSQPVCPGSPEGQPPGGRALAVGGSSSLQTGLQRCKKRGRKCGRRRRDSGKMRRNKEDWPLQPRREWERRLGGSEPQRPAHWMSSPNQEGSACAPNAGGPRGYPSSESCWAGRGESTREIGLKPPRPRDEASEELSGESRKPAGTAFWRMQVGRTVRYTNSRPDDSARPLINGGSTAITREEKERIILETASPEPPTVAAPQDGTAYRAIDQTLVRRILAGCSNQSAPNGSGDSQASLGMEPGTDYQPHQAVHQSRRQPRRLEVSQGNRHTKTRKAELVVTLQDGPPDLSRQPPRLGFRGRM